MTRRILIGGFVAACLAAVAQDLRAQTPAPPLALAPLADTIDQLAGCQRDLGAALAEVNHTRAEQLRGNLTPPAATLAAVVAANPDYVIDAKTLKITPKGKGGT